MIALALWVIAIAHQVNAQEKQAEIVNGADALLQVIDQQQIDIALDGIDDIARKRDAIQKAADGFVQKIVDSAIDQQKHDAIYQDYITYRNACSPRLGGKVLRIGPDWPLKDLASAALNIQAGALIVLDEGVYELPEARTLPASLWNDVAIVGSSPQKTTLKLARNAEFEFANRFRLEQLRIDCNDNYLFDVRTGGSVHMRGCEVFNYNSGAGGSCAVAINDGVVLAESCLFEGRTGRGMARSNGGTAFDLRQQCALFVRQSQFIDNDEIVRASFPCVFDGCTTLSIFGPTQALYYNGAKIWLRESRDLLDQPTKGTAFIHATDDLVFVKRAAGHDVQIDQQSQSLMDALNLPRRLPYWIGLIRHDSPELRAIAASHLSKLIGMEVSASPRQANEPNRLDAGSAALAAEVEFTRVMNWFESNRAKLSWDESAGRYVVRGN